VISPEWQQMSLGVVGVVARIQGVEAGLEAGLEAGNLVVNLSGMICPAQ
jgi:hypothetical protein